jgi:hypothetical protein
VILPEVAAYEAGLLDFLLRGELTLTVAGQITVSGTGLGAGSVEILAEDERGVRTSLANVQVAAQAAPAPAAAGATEPPAGEPIAQIAAPPTGTRVVAVYRGVDSAGEPLVAVGALPLSR